MFTSYKQLRRGSDYKTAARKGSEGEGCGSLRVILSLRLWLDSQKKERRDEGKKWKNLVYPGRGFLIGSVSYSVELMCNVNNLA